jgi:hypothetical protein
VRLIKIVDFPTTFTASESRFGTRFLSHPVHATSNCQIFHFYWWRRLRRPPPLRRPAKRRNWSPPPDRRSGAVECIITECTAVGRPRGLLIAVGWAARMQTDIHTYTCNPTDECSRQGATACARLQPDRAKVVWGPHLAPTQCDPLRVVGAAAAGVVHRYRVRAAGLVQWRNTGISTPRKTPTPPCLPKPRIIGNLIWQTTWPWVEFPERQFWTIRRPQHSETHYDIFIRLSQHFGLVLNH